MKNLLLDIGTLRCLQASQLTGLPSRSAETLRLRRPQQPDQFSREIESTLCCSAGLADSGRGDRFMGGLNRLTIQDGQELAKPLSNPLRDLLRFRARYLFVQQLKLGHGFAS